jgi:DNA-binding NarL/FixJ family response regulator
MTTIFISDDHKLIRDTWSIILNRDKRFKVIGTSSDSAETVKKCRKLKPDILLTDINMKPFSGIEATRLIRRICPQTRIIAVTMHNQPGIAKKMLQAGAMGYVTKNSSAKEMTDAIAEVSAGNIYVCTEIKELLSVYEKDTDGLSGAHLLTEREIEVINLVTQGCSSKDISEALDISFRTVETHRHNVLKKLKIKNSISLIEFMNSHAIHI